MVKKITRMLCAAVLTAAAMALSAAAVNVTAAPSSHQVYVDGERANVAAYLIDGNNYFKLRDVAAILNGTDAQVGWAIAMCICGFLLIYGIEYAGRRIAAKKSQQ